MLLEKVKKYYSEELNFNCAETIVYAANEEYNLNLDKNTFKTMAAFGGGMGVEGTCGGVSGALAVLGIVFTKEKAHESDRIKLLAQEFFKSFEGKLKSSNCKSLKEMYRNDEIRCSKILYTVAEVLDDIVTREKNDQ